MTENHDIAQHASAADSPRAAVCGIPEYAIERFETVFRSAVKGQRLYPADPDDAWQACYEKLLRRAESFPQLTAANEKTYWFNTIDGILRSWIKRNVIPLRESYREKERLYTGRRGHVGLDAFDADNWDPTSLVGSREMVATGQFDCEDGEDAAFADEHETGDEFRRAATIRDYAEVIGSRGHDPWRELRAKETLAALRRMIADELGDDATEILAAFSSYVRHDGNSFAIAKDLGLPKSTFYRRWRKYLATAKKIWEKRLGR